MDKQGQQRSAIVLGVPIGEEEVVSLGIVGRRIFRADLGSQDDSRYD